MGRRRSRVPDGSRRNWSRAGDFWVTARTTSAISPSRLSRSWLFMCAPWWRAATSAVMSGGFSNRRRTARRPLHARPSSPRGSWLGSAQSGSPAQPGKGSSTWPARPRAGWAPRSSSGTGAASPRSAVDRAVGRTVLRRKSAWSFLAPAAAGPPRSAPQECRFSSRRERVAVRSRDCRP